MAKTRIMEKMEDIPKRIEIFLLLLIFLLAIGTIGFKIIIGVGFSEAFIMTLETLAFMFHAESGLGKALEVFLAVFGVFLIWWILWRVFDMFLEGNFTEYLKISRFFNKLRKMRNHYIIAGGGRVGEEIARNLANSKIDYIIIEKDIPTVNKLRKLGYMAISGDVVDENVLKQANINTAKSIIIAMPETEKNLLVTMLAKELNYNIEIMARADKPAFVSKLKKAGAKIVVVPETVAAEKFLSEILK